jgi:hypothetical protein
MENKLPEQDESKNILAFPLEFRAAPSSLNTARLPQPLQTNSTISTLKSLDANIINAIVSKFTEVYVAQARASQTKLLNLEIHLHALFSAYPELHSSSVSKKILTSLVDSRLLKSLPPKKADNLCRNLMRFVAFSSKVLPHETNVYLSSEDTLTLEVRKHKKHATIRFDEDIIHAAFVTKGSLVTKAHFKQKAFPASSGGVVDASDEFNRFLR